MLRLNTSQLRHLTRFMATHLNLLSPPSTLVLPLTPSWISTTTWILLLRKRMALELSWTVISDPAVHSIRDSTYKTYIRPMVEYASTIWDPHTRRNINKLEQVQRHSAHYVTGNHDYTSSISAMVYDLEWTTLEQCRHHCRLTMLYKIYNRLVDTDFTCQLTLTQSSTRGHASRFLQQVQLCCLLQLILSWYYSGLECNGDGSTTFPDCWCLQELPLHWPVMSSLPFLAWPLLPAGNVAYPAAVRLSSPRKSHC